MRIHSQPRTRDRERRIFGLFLLLAGLALVACVPLDPYHTGPTPRECGDRPEGDCLTTFVEKHEEYLLGFVEFDDLGWAWNREQGRVLFREIRKVERDVLMVLFAHGWKHNADSCDTNVTCFREALRGLHAAETALYGENARQIVGVYVGWRGDSAKGSVPKQLSFFDRKATAHKVGSGSLTELIVRLKEERTMRGGNSRLVIVGHSFGGAAIFSATSQLIMDRLATADERGGAVRGLGDLVVLVNPAFEAARYQPLHETLNEKTVGSDAGQPDDQGELSAPSRRRCSRSSPPRATPRPASGSRAAAPWRRARTRTARTCRSAPTAKRSDTSRNSAPTASRQRARRSRFQRSMTGTPRGAAAPTVQRPCTR